MNERDAGVTYCHQNYNSCCGVKIFAVRVNKTNSVHHGGEEWSDISEVCRLQRLNSEMYCCIPTSGDLPRSVQ